MGDTLATIWFQDASRSDLGSILDGSGPLLGRPEVSKMEKQIDCVVTSILECLVDGF